MEESLIELPVFIKETQSIITLFLTQEEINKIKTDKKLLESLVNEEISKQNNSTDFTSSSEISQPLESSENFQSEKNEYLTSYKELWPDDAVYLLLKLYREKESDFNLGSKRNGIVWAELAKKMKENSNGKYAVNGLQCSIKISGLKRTFKNIKDQNKKSGNCQNKNRKPWAFYSIMDSIFGKKTFMMPPVITSSESSLKPKNVANSGVAELSSLPSNPCKRRSVEIVLKTSIDDIKQNKKVAIAKREGRRKECEKIKKNNMPSVRKNEGKFIRLQWNVKKNEGRFTRIKWRSKS